MLSRKTLEIAIDALLDELEANGGDLEHAIALTEIRAELKEREEQAKKNEPAVKLIDEWLAEPAEQEIGEKWVIMSKDYGLLTRVFYKTKADAESFLVAAGFEEEVIKVRLVKVEAPDESEG